MIVALGSSCPVGAPDTGGWQLAGTARMSGEELVLTGPEGGCGAGWSPGSLDAGVPFRMRFLCYFGDSTGVGSGQASLVLVQEVPDPPMCITGGEFVGIEFRINGGEPMEDTIALVIQPDTFSHGTRQALPAGNLDNGLVHSLSVSWDPGRARFYVWLDGMEEPVLAAFESDFFSGRFPSPSALRWGFTGSTSCPGRLQWFMPDSGTAGRER